MSSIKIFPHLLPGMTLGGVFVDDCDRDTVGVERSLEFVRGFFSGPSINGACSPQPSVTSDAGGRGSRLTQGNLSPGGKGEAGGSGGVSGGKGDTSVVGVIGAASSVVSIQVASLLRLFHIPQVSKIRF
ncbi:metabotropic glutamate receptor 2-like [Convolutriloba macropyga]|uniref:metabotropic glutamate receptor 2-like n=1 Tax=Convolutriloba macropyga TaxID=536237 RepID=UPI003F522A50